MSAFTPTHMWRTDFWSVAAGPIPVEVIGDAWGGHVTIRIDGHLGVTYLARRDELTPIEQEQS